MDPLLPRKTEVRVDWTFLRAWWDSQKRKMDGRGQESAAVGGTKGLYAFAEKRSRTYEVTSSGWCGLVSEEGKEESERARSGSARLDAIVGRNEADDAGRKKERRAHLDAEELHGRSRPQTDGRHPRNVYFSPEKRCQPDPARLRELRKK